MNSLERMSHIKCSSNSEVSCQSTAHDSWTPTLISNLYNRKSQIPKRFPARKVLLIPDYLVQKNMPGAIMECGDFSDFQDALKKMRRVDDIIINTINSAIPTDSFHPDAKKVCLELQNKIDESNNKREGAIKTCITVSADKVKKLKEQRESNTENIQLSKELRAEQTKLRMLRVELSVEELVKQRTSQVFNERCRKYMV